MRSLTKTLGEYIDYNIILGTKFIILGFEKLGLQSSSIFWASRVWCCLPGCLGGGVAVGLFVVSGAASFLFAVVRCGTAL